MKNSFLSCENRVAIIVSLDVMLAKRKMRSKELAEQVGITEQNLSLLKNGKVKGVRLETLDKICRILDCQPGDLLAWQPDGEVRSQRTRKCAEPAGPFLRLALSY